MRRRSIPRLACALALAGASLLVPAAAQAFKIDARGAFLAPISPHGESHDAIHERLTEAAIRSVTPDASTILILNVIRGVENTDITHQWDGEYHFDNASVALGKGFADAFAAVRLELEAARRNAAGNPEFLDPTYTSFAQIANDLERTLRQVASLPVCEQAAPRCPRELRQLADRIADAKTATPLVRLSLNPFPDPHRPTEKGSLFAKQPRGKRCGLCGALAPINEGYVSIVEEVESVARLAVTKVRTFVPRKADPRRVRIERIPDALRAYRAFQDLGHAFHTTQDFFAHTNYVELQAGVPVGTPIPASTPIPTPTDFAQFTLDGLRALLPRFAELESGAVVTRWLGEGDFCAGNVFNPAGGPIRLKLVGLTLPGGGENPDPPAGFHYCHYTTRTVVGLNKDEPPGPDPSKNEASYANHVPARDAALRVSAALWRSFLASLGAACPTGGTSCPDDGPLDLWSGSWEVTVKGVQWAPGQATACCVDLRRIPEQEGRPLVGQPYAGRTFGPCPDETVFYRGTVGFGLGGDVLACSDGNDLVGIFANRESTQLPAQYTPLQEAATLRATWQTSAFIGTWTPGTFSLEWTGRCVAGTCLPAGSTR